MSYQIGDQILELKDDGSQWYNYFTIRLKDRKGYYVSWKKTTENAFPSFYFNTFTDAKNAIRNEFDWKKLVDEAFEKEVLSE